MFRLFAVNCQGYTFVELLLAITILGMVITPLYSLLSGSRQMIAVAGNKTIAISLCREKLESLKAEGYANLYQHYQALGNEPLIEHDPVDTPQFQRETIIQPFNPADIISCEESQLPSANLFEIEVTVSWPLPQPKYSEKLITLVGEW